MNFSKHLKELRKEKGMSQNDLAMLFGYKSFTTIQKWEDGSAMPPLRVLQGLAELFMCSVDELVSGSITKAIPILGTVRGGPSQLAQEDWLGQELVLAHEAHFGEYFYLEVIGDSMIDARIFPKDLIYVRRQDQVSNGEIAVVLLNDEATVKRIYFDGDKMILHPENKAYEDLVLGPQDIENDNVSILGKVIHVKIRL